MAYKRKFHDRLFARLSQDGWTISIHDEGLEWWVHEVWALKSIWSPRGFLLYLTFLVDPQPGSVEPFERLHCGFNWPENRLEPGDGPSMLFPEWPENLDQFVSELNELRSSAES